MGDLDFLTETSFQYRGNHATHPHIMTASTSTTITSLAASI